MRAVGGEEGFELLLRLGVLAGAIGVDRGVELLLRRVGEVDPGAGDGRRAGDVGRRDVGDDRSGRRGERPGGRRRGGPAADVERRAGGQRRARRRRAERARRARGVGIGVGVEGVAAARLDAGRQVGPWRGGDDDRRRRAGRRGGSDRRCAGRRRGCAAEAVFDVLLEAPELVLQQALLVLQLFDAAVGLSEFVFEPVEPAPPSAAGSLGSTASGPTPGITAGGAVCAGWTGEAMWNGLRSKAEAPLTPATPTQKKATLAQRRRESGVTASNLYRDQPAAAETAPDLR